MKHPDAITRRYEKEMDEAQDRHRQALAHIALVYQGNLMLRQAEQDRYDVAMGRLAAQYRAATRVAMLYRPRLP